MAGVRASSSDTLNITTIGASRRYNMITRTSDGERILQLASSGFVREANRNADKQRMMWKTLLWPHPPTKTIPVLNEGRGRLFLQLIEISMLKKYLTKRTKFVKIYS